MDESIYQDMDEADLLRLVVASGVSCSLLLGGVITVNVLRGMLRVWMLGGVTTLDQALGDDFSMCQYGMEAGDVVRTLSCGHVFHEACISSIDKWLREKDLACPACRKTARSVRVLPWKPQPSLESAASSSSQTLVRLAPEETDLEGQHQSPPSPLSSAGTSGSDDQPLLPPPASP
ncbi:hypothetical protein E2562_010938 [Oryza meyeriana var. granulata]|uniref:RING-type domain-containing protein n=1 Tax=Oryza meyeriana var. granulata TaxID=110450 RepID=A0A6G1BUQ8_9ORYZ|nr:hypothetical protein E2562_010938 [Oryza meyeriana var. granulata]